MKHNKFSKFIEHILVCLPLLFLGITSAYVVFNKNAKDSYSDFTIDKLTLVVNGSQQIEGQTYLLDFDNTLSVTGTSNPVYFSSTTIDFSQFSGVNYQVTGYRIHNSGQYIYLYDTGGVQHTHNTTYQQMYDIMNGKTIVYSTGGLSATDRYYINYYLVSFYTSKLDNVLPYAMGEFNKLGFGKIPFTSFFTSIFMNGETNVYVEFVNSYLNYFLFVEATYFLPMVIYWFIHFGERLIDKFSNKEF